MPIAFSCACGSRLKARDGSEGRHLRCPKCENLVVVPFPEPPPAEEPAKSSVEDDAFQLFSSMPDEARQPIRAMPVKSEADSIPRSPSPPTPKEDTWRSSRQYKEEVPEPPLQKKKKNKPASQMNVGQVGIGLLMIVGAIVWFVLGLAADRIFFYPPVLLVLGIIAMAKGFLGVED